MKDVKIVEEIFEIEKPLVAELFSQTGWTKEEIAKTRTTEAKVVYLKKDIPILITGRMSTEIKADFFFEEFLNKIEKTKFSDYLLLTTFYDWIDSENEILSTVIFKPKAFQKNEIVDDILFISNGYLVYEYQFDFLAQIFLGINKDEAKTLRQNAINLKKPNAYDAFSSDKLNAFQNVIKEREVNALNGLLGSPDFVGAKHLYDFNLNK